ncbi:MAG: signal peptidase I [Deltaproteobacteria bacterium]
MKQFLEWAKELISIVIIAFILAMLLRTFIIEGRVVPTGSMLPTIKLGDRLLVNKFIYYFKKPTRGDIVVFKPPEVLNAKYDYVKRVIGLPGDKIEIKDSKLYINDKEIQEPYIAQPMSQDFGPVTVPENSLLVMGDNRNASYDSRYWPAWLTQDRLIGKAFCIYWPVDDLTLLQRQTSLITNGFPVIGDTPITMYIG